mmetsp:Transcript_21287/g.46725  ORF Transcript_21287/g.46725 Transcript_21287/m.46725 type:complete len:273 (-) Transcript_21287:224-1042(-)
MGVVDHQRGAKGHELIKVIHEKSEPARILVRFLKAIMDALQHIRCMQPSVEKNLACWPVGLLNGRGKRKHLVKIQFEESHQVIVDYQLHENTLADMVGCGFRNNVDIKIPVFQWLQGSLEVVCFCLGQSAQHRQMRPPLGVILILKIWSPVFCNAILAGCGNSRSHIIEVDLRLSWVLHPTGNPSGRGVATVGIILHTHGVQLVGRDNCGHPLQIILDVLGQGLVGLQVINRLQHPVNVGAHVWPRGILLQVAELFPTGRHLPNNNDNSQEA